MAGDDEVSSSQRCSLIKLNISIALEGLLSLEGIVNELCCWVSVYRCQSIGGED